ncbi:vitamin K epoxide reductase family protein [Agromyces atrinae]|uniref:Putative membrane protein n=1 Tax=Agromyces atrinae TaxID=592376 RepID=A0A4Q2M5K3_9MICO|nr:vitamin K epoxide reductase family protein [Agromyces atrinae]MCI2958580.1 vitamin K epoxide reductase family protein [Agromyces atrinae]NYD66199.1 putative membrane protein [Agromyces atrinae]RXZ86537.1 vitamin K epoxide reductase family protein [Agromyces atrinae]
MSSNAPHSRRSIFPALWLIALGALGLLAAFELTVEKFLVLSDPNHVPSCNVGIFLGCSTNLSSWQGAVFGFPNPIVGLMAWPVVITIGVALLAGVRLPRWFWAGFNIGVAGALIFVGWLIYQSIYVLDVLCPWCMLTWAVTIPVFWIVTLDNLREGRIPTSARVRRLARGWFGWIPIITLASYAVVILLAQVRMDAIPRAILDLQGLFG